MVHANFTQKLYVLTDTISELVLNILLNKNKQTEATLGGENEPST